MMFNCHTNVEYCSSVMSYKYIHKYITKGHDRIKVQVDDNKFKNITDEISEYLDARYIGLQEAAWRIFSLSLNGRSHSVMMLDVHLEDDNHVTFKEGQELAAVNKSTTAMLLEFFELKKLYEFSRKLTYDKIPVHYLWVEKNKKWTRQKNTVKTVSRMCHVIC
jgi:hypothetical protein